jgi:hypothetical protein
MKVRIPGKAENMEAIPTASETAARPPGHIHAHHLGEFAYTRNGVAYSGQRLGRELAVNRQVVAGYHYRRGNQRDNAHEALYQHRAEAYHLRVRLALYHLGVVPDDISGGNRIWPTVLSL